MKKSIILAVAIVIAGAMLPLAVSQFKSYERTVDVKGLCEQEVKADKVIWPLNYKVMSNDLSDALRQVEEQNARILEFLKNGGITSDEISIKAPEISDKYASEYGGNDRKFRYLLTSIITVCSSKVDMVISLQSDVPELMKAGILLGGNSWESPAPQYSFEALNSIKPEMIEKATSNARQAAQKFAQDSGSRLGKIKNATQGTFSIEDRDSNTPYIKRVRVVTYVTYYLKN